MTDRSPVADQAFLERLTRAQQEPFQGWDFSRLRGRMETEPLPWDYEAIVREALVGVGSLLDMETGGGEILSGLQPLPPRTVATEAYPPNIPIARARLEPLGVRVLEVSGDEALPLPSGSFDLITNRHGAYRPEEIVRVLRPGGRFITQQVGGHNLQDLNERMGVATCTFDRWRLDRARRELENAGLAIDVAEESFPVTRFRDVEAIVYLLTVVP